MKNSMQLRIGLIGLVMLPAGVMVFSLSLGASPIVPSGFYTGPAIFLLGLVLVVMAVKSLLGEGQ